MNPHIDRDYGEINVFDAARYFSGYEMHGTVYKNHSIVNTRSILEAPDQPRRESNLVLRTTDEKPISKANEPTSPGVRLSLLLNSLFKKSNSKRNKQKQLESPAVPNTNVLKTGPEGEPASQPVGLTGRFNRSGTGQNPVEPGTDHCPVRGPTGSTGRSVPVFKTLPNTPKSYPLSPKTSKTLEHQSQCNDGCARELWRDRRLDGIRVVGKSWVLSNSAKDEGLSCKILLGEKGLKNKEDDGCSSDASSDLFELENYN